MQRGVGGGGGGVKQQTRCIMGNVQMVNALFKKKNKISCFESHFLQDQDFSTSKKKEE